VRSIIQFRFDVDQWIAGNNTVIKRVAKTRFNCWDVFTWNNTTDNCIFEFKASAFFVWRELDPNVSELTATTRLTYELAFNFCRLAERLTVRYLRSSDVCFNVEFASHTVNQDIKVKFTH